MVGSLVKQDYPTTTPDTSLADLIPFVAAMHTPLPVVDGEQILLGTVDRISVMLALGGAEDAAIDPIANQADNGQMNGATD